MGRESSGMVGFDLGPLLEGQMRTAKLKSAYNLLIIGPRGFGALSLRWIQFASVFRCARSSFSHAFDTHKYCPTCREAGKGDDPRVTFISPCDICASFSEEQLTKITHRKRYVKKPDKKM